MTETQVKTVELPGIQFGGDYNAEQWPQESWAEDIRLMKELGVTLVTVGVFSWALLEPEEGVFDFSYHDAIIGMLADAGIGVDLATPTAAPPAWFWAAHPEARVVDHDGRVLGYGSRGMASPSSAAYREACVRVATALATRYGSHPAVKLWHVHNEYGVPVTECYSDASVAAFRRWVEATYGSIDAVNRAWGTLFWGQLYRAWNEIDVPRASGSIVNQSLRLDFARFSNRQLIDCFRAERDAIRKHSDVPVTTNFMAGECYSVDYWSWVDEVDIVSNDNYLVPEDQENHILLAFAADLTRSFARGKPWILMEHSTSAVNWRGRNLAKRPGQMRRNSLQHVARGADSALFFQFRQSRFGAEKFHSALVPQAGTRTRVYQEACALGADVARLGQVAGSRVHASVAIAWDQDAFWAADMEWHPSTDLDHKERTYAFYRELWRRNVAVDFVHPGADIDRYAVVILPQMYLLSDVAAANLRRYVAAGGTLLASYFSGIVDEHDAVPDGAYPGQLRDVLGLAITEFLPLGQEEEIPLASGRTGTVWSEEIVLDGAAATDRFLAGPAQGLPAATANDFGAGRAHYLATRLDGEQLWETIADALGAAGVAVGEPSEGLERVVRVDEGGGEYVFLINHSDRPRAVSIRGRELITGAEADGDIVVPAGEVRVVSR